MNLSILYRGFLSSCNYGCPYCPFAKCRESKAQHQADAQALDRFLDWVQTQAHLHRISVFFTPWGEALIHRRYQHAFVRLSNMPHVDKVTIQTNLSCRLDWVEACDKSRIALWATYHPGETSRTQFLQRCAELIARQVAYSVGMVGLQDHKSEIAMMREALPPHIYLWVNAYKRVPDYYSADDVDFLTEIDPLFPLNNQRYPSQGKPCRTGEHVFSVDAEGIMRRCHFIREPIGNIYDANWERALRPRPCTNDTCGCHIGYVHMPHLQLDDIFGDRILERIPHPPLKHLDDK